MKVRIKLVQKLVDYRKSYKDKDKRLVGSALTKVGKKHEIVYLPIERRGARCTRRLDISVELEV